MKTSSPSPCLVVGGAQREAVDHGVDRHPHPGGQPQRVDLAAGLVAVDVAGVVVRGGDGAGREGLVHARLAADVDEDEPLQQVERQEAEQHHRHHARPAQLDGLGEHVEEGGAQHDAAGEGEQQVAAAHGPDQRQHAAGDGPDQDGEGVEAERLELGHDSSSPPSCAGCHPASSSQGAPGGNCDVDEGRAPRPPSSRARRRAGRPRRRAGPREYQSRWRRSSRTACSSSAAEGWWGRCRAPVLDLERHVAHHHLDPLVAGRRRAGSARPARRRLQLAEDPRVAAGATRHQHRVAAGLGAHPQRVGGGPDVAGAEHRDPHRRLDGAG